MSDSPSKNADLEDGTLPEIERWRESVVALQDTLKKRQDRPQVRQRVMSKYFASLFDILGHTPP
jgi:hypothetical protein